MADAVVEEIDGRRIQVDGHWLVDFASCNYLGLDLDLEVINQVPAYLARWGTHPSWARAIASPEPYRRVEAVVSELVGVSDVLAFPTLTHTHSGVLPALAGEGTVLVDLRAHRTIHDAATIAARGATVRRFRPGDVEHARRLLRAAPKGPRLVCMDGINSITGNPPDLPAFAALAREYDALLYVDDAHGFGIIGERDGYDPTPYGRRGNAIVRWFGERYDHIVLTAGFSKAYSSLLAFVTCSGGAEAVSQGDRAVLCVLRPRPGGVAGHGPRRAGDQPATGATTCGPCSGSGPGPCSSTWTSSASPPPTPRVSPWSSCPWPTHPNCTRPGTTCSTAASTWPSPPTRSSPATRPASASS